MADSELDQRLAILRYLEKKSTQILKLARARIKLHLNPMSSNLV